MGMVRTFQPSPAFSKLGVADLLGEEGTVKSGRGPSPAVSSLYTLGLQNYYECLVTSSFSRMDDAALKDLRHNTHV